MKKVIVITGASSGIGKMTSKFLLNKGYIVYGLSRTQGDNNTINFVKCDVTDKTQVKKAIDQIYNKEQNIYAVINNAGMGISGAVEYTKEEDITKIIDVNLRGVINVCQAVIPYLRLSKGKIINIGSVAGELTIPFQTFYSVTKAGVGVLSEALRMELRPFGIKVTCVMPGDTKTSFTKNRSKDEVEDGIYKDRIKNSIARMEKDEQYGKDPITVSKAIYHVLKKNNPPVKVTVGFNYKFLVFLKRLLPYKLVNYILYKMYAK